MKKHSVKVTRNEQVNILDVFLYLASNWFWFALAVVISLAIGYYRYSKINYRYTSTIVAILKNAGTGVRTVQMDNYERMINTVSMSNEDLVLHSRSLMADVVRAMDADVSYMEDIKNRNVELYRSLTPFRLVFARDTDDDPGLFHFTAVPQANHTLSSFPEIWERGWFPWGIHWPWVRDMLFCSLRTVTISTSTMKSG